MALVAALAWSSSSGPAAFAANSSSNALTFGSGEISFASRPLTFGVREIAFPSSLTATETPTTIEVTLPADILFDFDKADVRPQAQTTLHDLAALLRAKAKGAVAIHGYTDALGKDAYNQKLSEKRALAIKTWLATREGLSAMPFTTSGFGAKDPVAPNKNDDGSDNPEGRQLNRRVTLIMRK